MEKVSIIIPVYNREKEIQDAVKASLRQTYEDIEVIVVDDGSTDNTKYVVDGLANHSEKVKVVHQENKGVLKARKKGIEEASGEFIVFLDSDDLINPVYVEGMMEAQKLNNASVVMSRRYQIMKELRLLYRKYPSTITLSKEKEYLPTFWVGMTSKLYQKDKLEIVDVGLKANEDLAFNYYFMASQNQIACSNKSLYTQRYNSSSLAEHFIYGNVNHLENTILPLEEEKRLFVTNGLYEIYQEELEAIFIKNIYERVQNVEAQKHLSREKKTSLKQILLDYLAFHFPNYQKNKYAVNHFKGFPFDSFFWGNMGRWLARNFDVMEPSDSEETLKKIHTILAK